MRHNPPTPPTTSTSYDNDMTVTPQPDLDAVQNNSAGKSAEKQQKVHKEVTIQQEQVGDDEAEVANFELGDLLAQGKKGLAVDIIPKRDGSGGRDFNVRNAIGLKEDANWYTDNLVSLYCSLIF